MPTKKAEVEIKSKPKKIRTFSIINDYDANDRFEVKAANASEAAYLALEKLGWWVAKA